MKMEQFNRENNTAEQSARTVSQKYANKGKLRRVIALLSAVVVFFTMNTLKFEADTLEHYAMCGFEAHVHDETCLDENGQVVCGMDEHIHTDACFQQRPVKPEPTVLDEYVPLNTQVVLSSPMDALDAPVEEVSVSLGDDEGEAYDDGVLDVTYDEPAIPEIHEYRMDGEVAFLSDVLNGVGMSVSNITSVGEIIDDSILVEGDDFTVEPAEDIPGEYIIRAVRDFDRAELGIVDDAGVESIWLLNGIGVAPTQPVEAAATEEDIIYEETAAEASETAAADDGIETEEQQPVEKAVTETQEPAIEEALQETEAELEESPADDVTEAENETVENVSEENVTENTEEPEIEETADEAVTDGEPADEAETGLDEAETENTEATEAENTEVTGAENTEVTETENTEATEEENTEATETENTEVTEAENTEAVETESVETDETEVEDAAQEAEIAETETEIEDQAVRSVALDFTNYIATDDHAAYLYDAANAFVLVNAAEITSADGVEAVTEEEIAASEDATLVITGDGEYELDGVIYTVSGLVLPEKVVTNAEQNVTIATANEESTLLNVEPVFEESAEGYADIFSLFQAAEADPTLLSRLSDALFGVAYAEEVRELQMKLFNIGLQSTEDGSEVEPGTAVRVTTFFDAIEGVDFALYHIVDNQPVLVENAVVVEDGRAIGFDFEIDSLSPFALVYYTVTTREGETFTGYSLKTDEKALNAQQLLETLGVQAIATGVTCNDESVAIDGLDIALPESFEKIALTIEAGVDKYEITLLTGDELTAAVGDYAVSLDLSNAGLDDSASYKVEITQQPATDEEVAAVEAALSETLEDGTRKIAHVSDLEMVDISIINTETGLAVEPQGSVAVSLTRGGEAIPTVVHFRNDGEVETLPVENGTFTTDSFSAFTGSYTVDFEYNGYEFNMPGGGLLLLSELFEQLHIDESAADVANVAFTNDALLNIKKLNQGDSYRLYIDIFQGFTEEELDAMEPNTVMSVDKTAIDRVVNEDNWLITSLRPFDTAEALTIDMADGTRYVIDVTDAMETNSDGSVKMQSIATIRTSVSKKITQTEQERDARFDINMGVLLTKEGLHELQEAVKASTTDPNTIPPIVYDFSSIVAGSPIEGQISGTTIDLKDDGDVVGTVTIDPSGKAIIQYNDPAWVTRKTAIAANIVVSVGTNETNIPTNNEYTWSFPDSNSVTVKYKKNYSTEAKKYELTGSPETGYTATYTAKFKSTSAMQSLTFTDTLGADDLQKLNQSSITVTRDGQNVTSQWTKKSADDHGFVIEASNQPAGEYTVSYTTSITQAQYEAMQVGTESYENNSAKWNLNGNNEIPGGDTSFKIDKPKPPEPPVTVTKDSDKENQEVSRGGDINYTVRFESTKLNGLRINDKMTDVQILDPSSVVVKINGQTITTPAGFVNYNNDNSFSTWNMTDVFNYTFPEDGPYTEKTDGSKYTIEVTYKTTLIDQETAKANNIFDGVSVENVAEEGRYYEKDKTTSTVTFDKEVIHTVDKTAEALNVDADGKWVPGTQVNYVIKVGDGTTDLSDVRVVDKMTGLQKLNSGSVQISYGDDQHYSPLTTGIVYDSTQEYTTNQVDVLDFVLPQSAGYGPVFIKYSTTVMSQEDATRLGIYDPRAVNNDVNVGDKGHDGTSGNVPYLPEPKFPLTKTVEIDDNQKETSGATKLGGRVNYHLSFGDADIEDMSNVVIRDEMTDVQKLVGDVVVRLSEHLAADIMLQDGTVVPAGETSFVMPTSSSEGANDGVVWAAWLDDGKYSLDRNVRVFYYKLPEGVGKGPIYVDYAVNVIDEEEAKKAGINDTHNVYNTALSGNNSQTTEYPVDFPKNLPHNPTADKRWVAWDFNKKAVKWDILVDKTGNSAYPIENVKVTEKLTNMSYVTSQENNNGTRGLYSWEIDMTGAVLETASGKILVMGEDYEIYKGGLVNNVDIEPYFLIYNLTEPVTIHITYATDLSIIDGYKAHNTVTLNDGTTLYEAENTYNAPQFTIAKNGEIVSVSEGQEGLKNRVIKWTVYINPTKKEVNPDPEHVKFSDALPEGMTLIDADKWENNSTIDSGNPSIRVHYAQWQSSYVKVEPDENNNIPETNIEPSYHYENGVLNKQRYEVYYYTYIDDAEWERITSSASGAKTYDNIVSIEANGHTENGETEVTIKSEEYITKTDETKTGSYTGVDNKEHVDVVIGDDGKGSDYVSYKIEINPNAAALNRVDPVNPGDTVTYDPITLTDHISTNMDFDPSTLVIKKYGTPKDESTLTEVSAADEGLVVSYNDDTRLLAIAGLHDKTAYRIEYKNKVRTQGEDTFVNTATLTGGGSHSSTTSEKHKFENVTDESISYDMELDLRKIKETDITQYLPGVTFELWEVELAIDPSTLTDAQWEQLYIDTNNDEYSPWMLNSFKMVGKKKLDTVTTTAENRGVVRLPHKATGEPGDETGIQINPLTVYYWIETENTNPDFKAENVPHYFVLYPDKKMAYVDEDGNIVDKDDDNAQKVVKVVLSDEEKAKHQRYAWALDNLFSEANNAIVASMSSGVTWSVNNLETKYTTISATKTWKGDADNLFETRPNNGIKLTLYQKLGDGDWVIYDPKTETPRVNQNPVIIRGSTYTTTENGKTVTKEDWPKANWLRLPAYKIEKVLNQQSGEWDDVIVGYYTYKVVEDPVENYTTEYVSERKGENGEDIDLENDGVSGGIIDVTNTYIPPTTKIGVHKNFKVPEGTALPEQIIVHLMQIKTDKDGNVYAPVDYGMVRMLTEQNDWSELFTGLPTRDGNGNTYTYTVVEDTDALEDEGFTYTQTEYVLDGVKDSTSGGLISGTVEINNHGPGSLKIEKNVTINGIPVEVGDSGADGTYTFHVMRKVNDELVEITDKYEDETPKSPVTITIENGASNYAMVSGLDAGDYYIHEDAPTNGTSLTSGNDVKVVVVGGVDDPDAVDVGSFTNNIDKTRVKVRKTWVNANRDAEGNIINGTNNDWPRGMTVQMELRKVQDGSAEHVKVDTPSWYTQNNKTWSDTIVLNAVRQFGVFDNLDTLETGWTYVVDETIIGDNPERYEAFVGAIDADGNIEIVNAEKTQALFTKKWENTSNESGEGNYKRPNLKISFRLKQFYVNAAGEKVETAASATQTGIFAPKTIAENTVLNEEAGAVTITKEATTGAEWNVLWNNLPAEGEEAGTAVTYFYEVEELGVTASDVDAKADYETTYSEDKLTVTNRYNKATSAAVEKTWSDGKLHNDVNVTMTLYKSYIAYDGTGSLYSANVQVDNWKDTNGNAGTAPNGADDKITVTIKKKSTDTAVATFDLNATNSWTHDTGNVLRKGTEYVVSWEAANGVKGAELLSALDDQIKLTGFVEAKLNNVSIWPNDQWNAYNINTASSNVVLSFTTWSYHITGKSINDIVVLPNDSSVSVGPYSVTSQEQNSNVKYTVSTVLSGINKDTQIRFSLNGIEIGDYQLEDAPSQGVASVSATGSEDYILYSDSDEQMPANGDLTEVGSVVLNKDALAGVWAYEWGNLPLSDATSELYYYVKETAISNPALVEGEPEVEYEFRDAEPRTIARVKIKNIVKGGRLEVTKNATFNPTDNGANANKFYSFYVQNEDGKYVQNLKGDLGDTIKWFTLKHGETVVFPNLPEGNYTVKEDENAAKITGYTLKVSGDGDVSVSIENTSTVTLNNKYEPPFGSLTIIKSFTGATLTEDEKKQITFKVTGVGLPSEGITKTYAEFTEGKWTLAQNDGITAGETYTVVETNADIGKYTRTTTIKVNDGEASAAGNEIKADVLVAAASMSGTVVVTNDYTKEKINISGTKTWVDNRQHDNATEIGLTLKRKIEGEDNSKYVAVTEGYTFAWDGNTYTFSDLDKYVSNDDDPATVDDEKPYVYKVEETAVNVTETVNAGTENESTVKINYKSEVDGNNFTNTELTSITRTKAWAGGTWPESVKTVTFTLSATVTGMANYTIVGTELKKDATKEQPTVSWTDLPKYTLVSGAPVEIVYNVTETSVTVTTNSSEAIYSNPETIADHWTSRLEGETLTNIPRTIDVEGTKTWITNGIPVGHPTVKLYKIGIREDDPPTRQVVKAGTATSNDSDDEESTDPDMEPTWVDDEHYRFTGLRKYDDNNQEIVYKAVETEFRVKVDGNTYTYTVTWNQEDDTYTVTPSDSNAPAFVVLQSDNNLTNKEVKTTTVTKEWGVEDADESKIESITYHLTRKIDEVEDTTFNNDASNTVTVTKAESGTTDWGKTWNNLDAHGTITYTPDGGDATTVTGEFVYTVDETQFVVKWGEDDSTEVTYTVTKDGNNYTVENPQDDYHFWKATKSGDKFTNTLDETYLDVVKLWSMNGNIPTSDTEDSIDSISFYLYRKAGTSTGELVDSVTKKGAAAKFDEEENPTGAHPFTISKTQIMENGQGTGRYEWKRHIDGLEKTDGTNAYTYWIEEVVVPGYVTTPQITLNSSDGATVNSTANAPAESKIFITNSKYNVSLPSTGGPGTTIFYVLGSILTLLAMVLLITKKRTEGQGID